jgi:hypothetical protein
MSDHSVWAIERNVRFTDMLLLDFFHIINVQVKNLCWLQYIQGFFCERLDLYLWSKNIHMRETI